MPTKAAPQRRPDLTPRLRRLPAAPASNLDTFTNVDPKRFESESYSYNSRSRNNLKRGKS